MNALNNFIQYLKDVRSEMMKVSWPTRDDVIGATTVVVTFTVVLAVVVKIFDWGLSKALGVILSM